MYQNEAYVSQMESLLVMRFCFLIGNLTNAYKQFPIWYLSF